MKRLFRKSAPLRVLSLFFVHSSEPIHLREVARRLRMNPATVLRTLGVLVRDGWLVRRKERHAVFFSAAPTSAFKALKAAYTVSFIQDAGIPVAVAEKTKGLFSFLLFGSAAKGEDGLQSDYDFLLVCGSTDADADLLSGRLRREVNLKVFSVAEWKGVAETNPAFYRDVLAYSWVLLGEKPVVD